MLDFLEVAQVASDPVDVGTGGFFFDLLDGFISLLLLPVDHDHFGFGLGELARDLEADAICTASDHSDTTGEIVQLFLGADYCVKRGLHVGLVAGEIAVDDGGVMSDVDEMR